MNKIATAVVAVVALCGPALAQQGSVTVRVKDITSYRMAGAQQLVGEGLIVGLKGTGDKADVRAQEMAQALSGHSGYFSENLTPEAFASTNIARVQVTAEIDEGTTTAGARIHATVAAVSDKTKSVEGGILISTQLKFSDGVEYADAFGKVSISRAGGGGGANAGSPVGTVSATLIRDIQISFFETRVDENGMERREMVLILGSPDINTAKDIASKINSEREALGLSRAGGDDLGNRIAVARDVGSVVVEIPRKWWGNEVEFRYHIDNVSVNPDVAARVTINDVSGEIVITGNVRVLPGAVIAAGVTITVGANGAMPTTLADGAEAVDPPVPVNSTDASFAELVRALTLLNLTAAEKAEVLKTLAASGLLQGALKVVS